MASEVFQLAILLSLKDSASGQLNRVSADIHSATSKIEQDLRKLKGNSPEVKIKADSLRKTLNQLRDFEAYYDNLRERMNREMALAGVGVAGLALIGKGVKVAGNFQASMTDLRSSFAELSKDGKVNLDSLGKDMLQAEAIAMKLGNKLPGTTEDFIQMMQVLKQNGVAIKDIFEGAGDAVANLAVANGEVPKEIAKSYAQFAKLFNLKPAEYGKAADTMSRLFTSSGIKSDELIESLKYFQGRSGAALNLTGLDDAEKTLRIMGLLRKQGLEGSLAGTAFHNLFAGYTTAKNKKDNPIQALKDKEGIDLKFFDDKGKFAGLDNLFKQLEPLNKLTDEKRTSYLKEIFGEEGMSAATAIIKTGVDGWRQYNEEQNKTISLQQKVDEKSKDFNNQLEALTGSLKNLVVTGFSPLLPMLTDAANSSNSFVGSVQDFAKTHPTLTSTVAKIALIGTTVVTVTGSVRTLSTGLELLTAMRSGGGILSYFGGVSKGADEATKKAGLLQRTLGKMPSALSIGVTLAAIGAGWELIQWLREKADERKVESQNLNVRGQELNKNYQAENQTLKNQNKTPDYTARSNEIVNLLQEKNRGFEKTIDPSRLTFLEKLTQMGTAVGGKSTFDVFRDQKPLSNDDPRAKYFDSEFRKLIPKYTDKNEWANRNLFGNTNALGRAAQTVGGARFFQERSPMLSDPQQMANFREKALPQFGFGAELNKQIEDMLRIAFPESFAQSSQILTQQQTQLSEATSSLIQNFTGFSEQLTQQGQFTEIFTQQSQNVSTFGENLNNLQQPFSNTQTSVRDLGTTADRTKQSLYSIISSGNGVADSLDTLSGRISSWQPPTPKVETYTFGMPTPTSSQPNQSSGVNSLNFLNLGKGNATGGTVLSKGLAYIHADEDIVPAKVTKEYRGGVHDLISMVKNRNVAQSNGDTRLDANQNLTVNYSPKVTINGASEADKQQFQSMLHSHSKDLERIVTKALQNGRARS